MGRVPEIRAYTRKQCRTRLCKWLGYRTEIVYVLSGAKRYVLGVINQWTYHSYIHIRTDRLVAGRWEMGDDLPEWRDALKKITIGGPSGGKQPDSIVDRGSSVFARLTALVSHCSVVRYEDGTVRKPGWWTLLTFGSSWCVKLKDPDACAQMTVTAAALDDALALADLMLQSSDAPWEPDAYLKPPEPRRKK